MCLVFNPKCILADDESKHNASRFWLWIHTDFNDYIQVAIYKTQNFAIKTLPSKKTIPSGCNIQNTKLCHQNFALNNRYNYTFRLQYTNMTRKMKSGYSTAEELWLERKKSYLLPTALETTRRTSWYSVNWIGVEKKVSNSPVPNCRVRYFTNDPHPTLRFFCPKS